MDKQKNPVIDLAEWKAHGLLIPVSLFGMALVALHPYSLGVMFAPLEAEFGWSRSEIATGPLITALTTLLLAPVGGRAVDRYGPRRIAMIGLPLFSAAVAMISLAGPNILSWWALYGLLAGALVLIYPSVWTAAVVRRFSRNRGLALAITLSGTGVAAAVFPVIAANLVTTFGWRGAYIGLGIISFVVVFPLVVLFFDRSEIPAMAQPEATRAMADGKPKGELTAPKFVRLAAAAFVYSLCITVLGINAVPILMEDGFDLIVAAEVAGLLGIGTIVGRLLGGLLLDRIDARFVACGSGLGAVVAVSILLGFEQSTMAASLACFSLGLAAGAEFDACAYLCTRHFDPRNFAALFGTIGGLSGAASGVAPLLASAVYDRLGSYDPVLIGMIPVLIIACLLFLSLGRYPGDLEPAEQSAPQIAP